MGRETATELTTAKVCLSLSGVPNPLGGGPHDRLGAPAPPALPNGSIMELAAAFRLDSPGDAIITETIRMDRPWSATLFAR